MEPINSFFLTMFLSSLKKIFSSYIWVALYSILVLIAGIVWWLTTDVAITLGNL